MRAVANVSFLFSDKGAFVLPRIKAAAAAGFTAVECDWPGEVCTADSLKEALIEENLEPVLLNIFQGDTSKGESGFAALPGKEEDFAKSLYKSVEYANRIKINGSNLIKLHILSGNIFGDSADQEKTMISNLKKHADYLATQGVIGLIEPINAYSKPGYFMNNLSSAVRVVESVNHPNVRLQLDLFHLQMISGNITNTIKRVMPLVGHVQVAQSPNRNEPSSAGEINFDYVFKVLIESGYTGDVGCEYKPSGATEESLGWISQYGLTF